MGRQGHNHVRKIPTFKKLTRASKMHIYFNSIVPCTLLYPTRHFPLKFPAQISYVLFASYVVWSKSFRPDQLFRVTNKTTLLFFNIVSRYFNTLFNWYINLTIDGTIYPSQHFPFGVAFVCQAGNLWTLLRTSPLKYATLLEIYHKFYKITPLHSHNNITTAYRNCINLQKLTVN